VRELYAASQAGVPIELIVRGMCELRPGIPGVSETIRVRSIVGRFLEHSRFFVFENGGDRETYMGSADWMGRNLDRRVEITVPVLDKALQQHIWDDVLQPLLADNTKARWLRSDGTYVRRLPEDGEPLFCAQTASLERFKTH
jgi:polyphosphate kinase